MIKSYHKKIAIIGNAGSGKTTLAFQLHEKLKLPLYHLDQYYWLPNWQRLDYEKFIAVHEELCEKHEWIIEGSNLRLLHRRALQADVVIFLDMPRYLCIWRVLKRSVLHLGKVIPGNPKDCKQQIFSLKFLEFIRWVWNFNNCQRQMVLDTLDDHQFFTEKQIYILKSPNEIAAFVQQ